MSAVVSFFVNAVICFNFTLLLNLQIYKYKQNLLHFNTSLQMFMYIHNLPQTLNHLSSFVLVAQSTSW